jgi:putative phage-type endonuclease
VSGLTDAQHELRRSGVGASEVGAVLGLSRWHGPAEVWAAKVLGHRGETSYAAELGIALEAPVADAWARRASRLVVPVATLRHPEYRLALATPDRAVRAPGAGMPAGLEVRTREELASPDYEPRVLQVKTTGWRSVRDWGEEGTDEIPVEYLCQAHWEGTVAGVERVTFAVDVDRQELREYEVVVSAEVFGRMYEAVARWWRDYVVTKRPPPPDGSEGYSRVLSILHPREVLPVRETVEPGLLAQLVELVELRATVRDSKAREAVVAQTIRLALGDSAGAVGPWGSVSLRRTRDVRTVDWQAVAVEAQTVAQLAAQALPESQREQVVGALQGLVERHTKTRPGTRPLKVKLTEHGDDDGE